MSSLFTTDCSMQRSAVGFIDDQLADPLLLARGEPGVDADIAPGFRHDGLRSSLCAS